MDISYYCYDRRSIVSLTLSSRRTYDKRFEDLLFSLVDSQSLISQTAELLHPSTIALILCQTDKIYLDISATSSPISTAVKKDEIWPRCLTSRL